MSRTQLTYLLSFFIFVIPAYASADDAPPAAARHDQHATLEAPATENLNWAINAGAIFNYGNTRSFAGNIGTHFQLKTTDFAITADAQFTLGTAAGNGSAGMPRDTWVENARNLLLAARIDGFLTHEHALFFRAAFRNDPFANLNGRIQLQPGYGASFFQAENHRFWGEIGYDLTVDRYRTHASVQGAERYGLIQHSVRAFLGYDNHVQENVTYVTGVEALLDLANTNPINFRLNWTNELGVKVADDLSLSTKWNLFWNTAPPTSENVDLQTTLNLVYTLI